MDPLLQSAHEWLMNDDDIYGGNPEGKMMDIGNIDDLIDQMDVPLVDEDNVSGGVSQYITIQVPVAEAEVDRNPLIADLPEPRTGGHDFQTWMRNLFTGLKS